MTMLDDWRVDMKALDHRPDAASLELQAIERARAEYAKLFGPGRVVRIVSVIQRSHSLTVRMVVR